MSHVIPVPNEGQHIFKETFAMSTRENKRLNHLGILDLKTDQTIAMYQVLVNDEEVLLTSSFREAVAKYNSIG